MAPSADRERAVRKFYVLKEDTIAQDHASDRKKSLAKGQIVLVLNTPDASETVEIALVSDPLSGFQKMIEVLRRNRSRQTT
jgi:hypothetical protein